MQVGLEGVGGPGSLPGRQGAKGQQLFRSGRTQTPWDSGTGPPGRIGITFSRSMSHVTLEFQIKMSNFERSLSSAIVSLQIKNDQGRLGSSVS